MKWILRLRQEVKDGLVTAWLIAEDGQARSGLLHGTITPAKAEALAQAMAPVCTIERTEFTGDRMDEPRPKTSKARQDELFKEQP